MRSFVRFSEPRKNKWQWSLILVLSLLLLASSALVLFKVSHLSKTKQEYLDLQKRLEAFEQLLSEENKKLPELINQVEVATDIAEGLWQRQRVPPGSVCHLTLPGTKLGRTTGAGHKLAVLIPYRNREEHLGILDDLKGYLKAQGLDFDIFLIEQSERYRFNRGALLNVGVALLDGSDYDYFAFQDVDTVPNPGVGILYEFPAGPKPLHLTPPGLHPNVDFEDFFGGISIFTREQFAAVNGFGTGFWGWGREDDNMRLRLQKIGRWPPERPKVPPQAAGYYYSHKPHKKAPEVRVQAVNGQKEYFEVNPDVPYGKALIISSQPEMLLETLSGLNSTRFWIQSVNVFHGVVKYTVELHCDKKLTSWCE